MCNSTRLYSETLRVPSVPRLGQHIDCLILPCMGGERARAHRIFGLAPDLTLLDNDDAKRRLHLLTGWADGSATHARIWPLHGAGLPDPRAGRLGPLAHKYTRRAGTYFS